MDIRETQPQSPEENPVIIDYKTRFDITIYVKYGNRSQDTDNLETLERRILAKIQAATLTSGNLILERNDFQRGQIQDNPLNVVGIQSVLTLYFVERSAVTGIIGLQQTLDIGSIVGLKILSEFGPTGRNNSSRTNDAGNTVSNKGITNYERVWEYPYTRANFNIIQALIAADDKITVTLHETGQGDTSYTGKVTNQEVQVRFDQEKVVFMSFDVYTDT